MAVTPTRTDQDMALRLNALPDEARVAAIATAFALQRETLKAQLPGAAQAASAAEILGEDAVHDFLQWLATQNIQLVSSADDYGIDTIHPPGQLLERWKAERDA